MEDQQYNIKAVTIDNMLTLYVYSKDQTIGITIGGLSGSFFISQGSSIVSFPVPDDVLVIIKNYFLGE